MSQRSRDLRKLARTGLRRAFEGGQRLGVDVLPRHFYSSIPSLSELRGSRTWRQPRSTVGIRGLERETQLATLGRWFEDGVRERIGSRNIRAEGAERNGEIGYGPAESTILYAFIAHERPRRVVQVGAGVSTAVVLAAAEEAGYDVEVVCVDPFPTDFLVSLHEQGKITLIREPAQEVDLVQLTGLEEGDLLFVDSTHTVKPGSEVNRLVLDVLPRLQPGVWVHFHDIWIPYDYSRFVLTSAVFFWNESPLLHAFLVDNQRMAVEVCTSWLHYHAPREMAEIVPGYQPAANDDGLEVPDRPGNFPSAAYLRVSADAVAREPS